MEPKDKVIAKPVKEVSDVKSDHAALLFTTARDLIKALLKTPLKDADIAAALNITSSQAKVWLQRLVDESVIEKQKNL